MLQQETGDKGRPDGPFGSYAGFTFFYYREDRAVYQLEVDKGK